MNVTVDELQRAVAQQYRVERELGAGGMATVYLAHDPKHERRVAIKVLRPELAAIVGGERFLKEIRTTANLQHPHILPLHDSGEAGGLVYYVMPYVEGESLRQRLKREKQLPVDEAIRIAREVAGGLDYAHRHGVVHRDVKPENILLHDGQALIADFGIALAVSRTDGGTRMTETGMSLGTPHYMSPEQAMGEREITPRSDVYALACVLYEMLSGEPPFTGPTPQAIIARVITDEPRNLTTQRRSVPPAVEAAIMRALSKLPADRFASAAEFGEALTARTTSGAVPSPRTPMSLRRLAPLALMGAGAALMIAAATWLVRKVAGPDESVGPPARLAVPLPAGSFMVDVGTTPSVTLSPDGSTIVYTGETGRGSQLFVRRLVDVEATPIAATEGANNPFFSRDGSTIWYVLGSSWRRVPAAGGSPLPGTLQDAVASFFTHPLGILSTNTKGALIATRPDGSEHIIARPDSSLGELGLLPQDILPDGRILVLGQRQGFTGAVWIIDPDNAKRQLVTRALAAAAIYHDGLVAWVLTSGAWLAAPLGDGSADLASVATIIADNVRVAPGAPPQISISASSAVYSPSRPSDLVRVDRAGRAEVVGLQPRRFHSPRLSPDGRSILTDVTEEERDVWHLSLRDGTFSRLTFDKDGHDPQWLPDGRSFLYATARSSSVGIHRRSVDGSATDSVRHDGASLTAHAVTPDGKYALAVKSVANGSDLVRVALTGGILEPIVATPFTEQFTSLTPDGRWLAYTSNESGREEVYIRSMAGTGRIVVSRAGGTEPVWSRDGRELYYRDFEGPSLIAAAVATSPELRVTSRTRLFALTDYEAAVPHANYDVTPDGKFIFVRTVPATEFIYVQNWPAMVRRKQ